MTPVQRKLLNTQMRGQLHGAIARISDAVGRHSGKPDERTGDINQAIVLLIRAFGTSSALLWADDECERLSATAQR